MDRNDNNYFKRPTPETLENMFYGYDVPEAIKTRAKIIMRRFTIMGASDGMYIANTIAMENGSGDGRGSFEDLPITRVDAIVKALKNAYGCNIFDCDSEDLAEIIKTGTLSKQKMLCGLRNSAKIRRKRIAEIRNQRKEYSDAAKILSRFSNPREHIKAVHEANKDADNWRIEFLYGEINTIADTILAEKGGEYAYNMG